jgi:hypothetical protein
MQYPHHKEFSALFASDSDALVDEAFVQRCLTSIRRAQQRLLLLKVIIAVAVAGIVGLAVPTLTALAAIVPNWLFAAITAMDSMAGGLDRAAAIVVVLILSVRWFGLPSFRHRETQR